MRTIIVIISVLLVAAIGSTGILAQTSISEDYDVDVSVLSTWTQTSLYVIVNDTLFMHALGAVGAGADSIDWRDWSGPEGVYATQAGGCADCPLPGYPSRSLIARIGSGQPFYVGSFAAVVATSSGLLHVGINESSPGENVGTMRVFIWRRGDSPTATDDPESPVVSNVELYQNIPNPFNPLTTIRFYLPKPGRVTLDIFDVSGRLVVRLMDRVQPAGLGSIAWVGNDERGARAASGVYFCRLRAGGCVLTRKLILLR